MAAASVLARLRPQVGDDRSRLVDGDEQALLALGLLELARRRRAATPARRLLDAATEGAFEIRRRPLVLLHGNLGAEDLLAGEQPFEHGAHAGPLEALEVAGLERPGVPVDEVA